MALFIAWQDTLETITTYARTPIAQLWLLSIGRLYYHLLSPVTLAVIAASAVTLFFIPHTYGLLGIVQMLWIARLTYLARPSVGLKDRPYRLLFLTPEVFLPVGVLVLGLGVLYAILAWYLWAMVLTLAPLAFLCVYDLKPQFPVNVMRALVQTGTMVWNLLPLTAILLTIYTLLYACVHLLPHASLIHMALLIPVHVATLTLIYLITIHKHFEWYYA